MTISNEIGLKIKEQREIQGWTQEQLATKIGISTSMIGMIESGKSGASLKTIKKLSEVFKVDISYFVGSNKVYFENFAEHLTVEEKEFVNEKINKPWIELVKGISEHDLDPEDIREALAVLIKVSKKKKPL